MITAINEEKETLKVDNPRIDHPIIASFIREITTDTITCGCDDYEVCEYEAD